MQVRSPRTCFRVSPASPGRRAVPVHAEERSHLHVDGRSTGAPPGVPGAAGEGAPHELPWSVRPACRLAPEGDDASATCAAVTVEEDEEEEGPDDTKTGLGLPSSAYLRRRRLALPLWWPPPHSRHPLHPQDGLWSACFSSAINSPRESSSRPPPPSPRCPWLVDGQRQAGPPRSSVRHSSVQGAPRTGS